MWVRLVLALLAVMLWPPSGEASPISGPSATISLPLDGRAPFVLDAPGTTAKGGIVEVSYSEAAPAAASLNWLQYIASYGDLIRAYGANPAAGEQHYQRYGRAEGRSLDRFDERQYLANYADLRAAYGTDLVAATRHFIIYGYFEKRTDQPPRPATQPNFVFFFIDDLGYGEVGATSQADTVLPNIDAIAAAGVVATSGYVTAPLCAPSRAAVLTGRYQQTFGIYGNPPAEGSAGRLNGGLPATAKTLAERLRAVGYATGMVGKWNVGYRPDQHPMQRGFDEFFGVIGSAHPYYGEVPGDPVLRGTTPEPQKDYLTDVFAREAVSFIRRHADKPFFLYLPFTAIHAPLEATPEKLAQFSGITDRRRRTVAAMLSSLDDAVGAVTRTLREHGLADNTVVAFLGDNGCGPCRNGVLRGVKGTFYEGGIRVPFIVSWPGRLPAGGTSDVPVSSMDLSATFLDAAGASTAGLDGGNLLGALRGGDAPRECLFWRGKGRGATRCGDWKLIDGGGQPPELYDLRADRGESRNVASANAPVVARLRQAQAAWQRTLAPRVW